MKVEIPEDKIDANIELILEVVILGNVLNEPIEETRETLRKAMKKIMSESYENGLDAMRESILKNPSSLDAMRGIV